MSSAALTSRLRERAREEGFDAVGIAAAEPLERDGARLAEWLGLGRAAEMRWMSASASRRADPGALLPGCQSVVSVAMSYWPGAERASTPPGCGRVALYARGRDYHRIFSRRLRALATWLDDAAGSVSRPSVDTGPVLERAWAERAGIGWIGKNANLVTRSMGSWVLLGEVLTTAALEPETAAHADFCGSCTACLDACPTGAIVAPGEVDSNRCISYWTIEHRGTVPRERRSGIGEWIFGCDECQTVCPWSESFARSPEGDPFELREDLRRLDPLEIVGMGEAEFRARYSGTSLMRARWQGMRRNACIVLGNRKRPEDLAALECALGEADAELRAHAAWAIGQIGGAAALAALERARDREADAGVREEMACAIMAARTG